jgi:hypothetical protein
MLENYENPKGIPFLRSRLEKIKDDGSVAAKINIESYERAIAHLEAIKRQQESQDKKSPSETTTANQ